jgi:hypothetical protein
VLPVCCQPLIAGFLVHWPFEYRNTVAGYTGMLASARLSIETELAITGRTLIAIVGSLVSVWPAKPESY